MPETQTNAPAANSPEGVLERGKVERMKPVSNYEQSQNEQSQPAANSPAAEQAEGPASESPTGEPELSDEQAIAFLKKKGIEFDGQWDKLKKVSDPLILTPEQITKQKEEADAALEKRMISLYQDKGGKIEDYVSIKKIASADAKELAEFEARRELREEGFSVEEIEAEMLDRYMVGVDPANLERLEDESQEEYDARKKALEKKVKFGAKQLANRSSYLKKQAEELLNGYKATIESEDAEKQADLKFSAEVENHFKAMPRKTSIELVGDENLKIEPIEHEVSEDAIRLAEATLKDPLKMKQFFENQDGTPNLKNLSDILVGYYDRQEAQKRIYLSALTRNTGVFHNIFPARSAAQLGVNGTAQKNNQSNGVATTYGKVQPVR